MKHKALYLLKILRLATLCILTGCSDDEKPLDVRTAIVGHWYSVSVTSTRVNTISGAVTEYINEDKTIDIRMYDDGTCNMNNSLGSYKLLGNELDIYLPNPKNQSTMNLYHYTIAEISETKMILTNVEYIEKREKSLSVTWEVTYKYQLEKRE